MSSALPLYNLKYPLDYLKFTIGIIQKKKPLKKIERLSFFQIMKTKRTNLTIYI